MKKIIFCVLFLCMLLIINGQSFKLIKDELPKDHVFNKVKLVLKSLNERFFSEFKLYTRRAVVEDKDYSEKEKKEIIDKVEKYEYKKNQFFSYTMAYDRPFLDDELNIKFQLVNSKNEDLIDDLSLFRIKHYIISNYGTRISYNYTWIIVSKIPITRKVLDKSSLPIQLILTFPNGKKRIYDVRVTM